MKEDRCLKEIDKSVYCMMETWKKTGIKLWTCSTILPSLTNWITRKIPTVQKQNKNTNQR